MSCCFERGNKIVTTTDEICRPQMNGNAEVYFDKTLSLVATMYQDRDGKYLVTSQPLPFPSLVILSSCDTFLSGKIWKVCVSNENKIWKL